MVLCAIWQEQRHSFRQRSENFLHSKTSYTRFTQATRKFKRINAFARIKNKIWCMDLAYVDKLTKDNDGVKFLLLRQDLLIRTVDAKENKTKTQKKQSRKFQKRLPKRRKQKKLGRSEDRTCWRV